MGRAAAKSWDAEATDAKGYWVSNASAVESLAVESLAGLDLIDEGLDVPEFTLSGSTDAGREVARATESTLEQPLETWEVIDTQIPDDAFADQPTEEKPRRRKANVLVSRRSVSGSMRDPKVSDPKRSAPGTPVASREQVVVSSPIGDAPMYTDEATPVHGRKVRPAAPSLDDKKALAARMVAEAKARAAGESAASEPSLAERRALAAQMAAAAKQRSRVVRLADHRPPGTLPPMEELAEPSAQLPPVDLPESSRESWGWDEADPLAMAAVPERPSLAVVQTAPGGEEGYDDVLATPMPAPPRPQLSVPWPLPARRAQTTEAQAMQVPFPVNAVEDADLPADPFDGYDPDEGSLLGTVALVGGVLAGTAILACGGMLLVATSTVVGVLAAM